VLFILLKDASRGQHHVFKLYTGSVAKPNRLLINVQWTYEKRNMWKIDLSPKKPTSHEKWDMGKRHLWVPSSACFLCETPKLQHFVNISVVFYMFIILVSVLFYWHILIVWNNRFKYIFMYVYKLLYFLSWFHHQKLWPWLLGFRVTHLVLGWPSSSLCFAYTVCCVLHWILMPLLFTIFLQKPHSLIVNSCLILGSSPFSLPSIPITCYVFW
jgi:hypothetical protein